MQICNSTYTHTQNMLRRVSYAGYDELKHHKAPALNLDEVGHGKTQGTPQMASDRPEVPPCHHHLYLWQIRYESFVNDL